MKGHGKKYQVLGKFTIETKRGMVHAGGYVYESDFPGGVIEQLLQRNPPKIVSVDESVIETEPEPESEVELEPEQKPKTITADYLKDNYTKVQLQGFALNEYDLDLADNMKKSDMIDAIMEQIDSEEKPSFSFGRD
jgi:hypothetical protein